MDEPWLLYVHLYILNFKFIKIFFQIRKNFHFFKTFFFEVERKTFHDICERGRRVLLIKGSVALERLLFADFLIWRIDTLYFIEVLRRELRASMKRWKKAEFFGCGCCNRLKKLILCKNSSKIKNVCNRFPKVIQPFCMKKNQGILSEHLSGLGRK